MNVKAINIKKTGKTINDGGRLLICFDYVLENNKRIKTKYIGFQDDYLKQGFVEEGETEKGRFLKVHLLDENEFEYRRKVLHIREGCNLETLSIWEKTDPELYQKLNEQLEGIGK